METGFLCCSLQVAEYLNDQEVLDWAVKRLGQAVYSAVRGKYRQLYNQRNMADASFWRQMLRPQDISLTGALPNTVSEYVSDKSCPGVALELRWLLLPLLTRG